MDTDGRIRGQVSRRTALSQLGIVGVGAVTASSLLSACNDKGGGTGASGGNGNLTTDNNPKPASDATKAANKQLLDTLPFDNRSDFDDAQRDLVDRPDTLTIKGADGNVVWDLEEYKKYIAID